MKQLAAILIAWVCTQGVYATPTDPTNEPPTAKVAVMNSLEDIKLFYVNEANSQVNVTLYDVKGRKLYSDRIRSKKGFIQPFNFSNLNEGRYVFEVTDEEGTIVQEFDHYKTVPSQIKTSVYRVKDSDKYRLSVVNESEQPVKISIFDSRLNKVYSESIDNPGSFTKTYDLEKLLENGYTFKVSNKKGTSYSYVQ